jgi:hypothetical protein
MLVAPLPERHTMSAFGKVLRLWDRVHRAGRGRGAWEFRRLHPTGVLTAFNTSNTANYTHC